MHTDPSRDETWNISELGSLMGTSDVIPMWSEIEDLPMWEREWSDNWPVPLEDDQYEDDVDE